MFYSIISCCQQFVKALYFVFHDVVCILSWKNLLLSGSCIIDRVMKRNMQLYLVTWVSVLHCSVAFTRVGWHMYINVPHRALYTSKGINWNHQMWAMHKFAGSSQIWCRYSWVYHCSPIAINGCWSVCMLVWIHSRLAGDTDSSIHQSSFGNLHWNSDETVMITRMFAVHRSEKVALLLCKQVCCSNHGYNTVFIRENG